MRGSKVKPKSVTIGKREKIFNNRVPNLGPFNHGSGSYGSQPFLVKADENQRTPAVSYFSKHKGESSNVVSNWD